MYYKSKYDEKYALIIGINDCGTLGILDNAENDAIGLKEILVNKYKYKEDNVTLLVGKNATKKNINDKLYGYASELCGDDSLLIYYAGHGTTILDGKQNNTGFLVPYGGNEQNYNTLIAWNEILDATKLAKCKHVFYIFDACYSGLAFNRGINIGASRFVSQVLTRYSRQAITAGKGDQTVSDAKGPLPNHSLFSGYLLKYLDEANVDEDAVSAQSVMAYLYNNVSTNTNTCQIPQYGHLDGDGDFIFNPEVIEKKGTEGENNEKTIEVVYPDDIQIYNSINKPIEEIKELISDKKNKVKINELVNLELRIALNKINNITNFDCANDEIFIDYIKKYEESVTNLIPIVIYLAQFGDNEYNSLLKKIISRLIPKKQIAGITNLLKLRYYPTLLIIYSIIITCIENNNIELLKEILYLESDSLNIYNIETKNVLFNVSYEMANISRNFSLLFENKKEPFRFPMNEHIYFFC